MLPLFPILLLLPTFGQGLTIQPGDLMRLIEKGLEYADSAIMDAIGKLLATQKIPDLSGSSGMFSYRLANIIIKDTKPPMSTMTVNSGLDGLTWKLDDFRINLYGDWSVEADMGLLSLPFSGSVDIILALILVTVTVDLEVDHASRPPLKAFNINCNSHKVWVSLNFHGGGAWFWNLLSRRLEGLVTDNVNLCDMVDSHTKKAVEVQLVPGFPDFDVLWTVPRMHSTPPDKSS